MDVVPHIFHVVPIALHRSLPTGHLSVGIPRGGCGSTFRTIKTATFQVAHYGLG